jgi:hypothetical protein
LILSIALKNHDQAAKIKDESMIISTLNNNSCTFLEILKANNMVKFAL